MTDRRDYFGLDPNGLRSRRCPACDGLVSVDTKLDDDGTKQHFCSQCGHDLGSEGANSFQPPEPSDL